MKRIAISLLLVLQVLFFLHAKGQMPTREEIIEKGIRSIRGSITYTDAHGQDSFSYQNSYTEYNKQGLMVLGENSSLKRNPDDRQYYIQIKRTTITYDQMGNMLSYTDYSTQLNKRGDTLQPIIPLSLTRYTYTPDSIFSYLYSYARPDSLRYHGCHQEKRPAITPKPQTLPKNVSRNGFSYDSLGRLVKECYERFETDHAFGGYARGCQACTYYEYTAFGKLLSAKEDSECGIVREMVSRYHYNQDRLCTGMVRSYYFEPKNGSMKLYNEHQERQDYAYTFYEQ